MCLEQGLNTTTNCIIVAIIIKIHIPSLKKKKVIRKKVRYVWNHTVEPSILFYLGMHLRQYYTHEVF